MIGFSLFLLVGNFFRSQSEAFRSEIAELNLRMASSYISSLSINFVDSCKQCDYVETRAVLKNISAGYYFQINLSSIGLNISTLPDYKSFVSSLHNLNESTYMEGNKVSIQTINLMFNRTKNELEVK
jgi:hypothetical protein